MHHERFKGVSRTLNDGLFSLQQIQYILHCRLCDAAPVTRNGDGGVSINSFGCNPVRSSIHPSPEATSLNWLRRCSFTYSVSRFQLITHLPRSTLIGRGFPSSPRRCQSHSLKVKRFGSRTDFKYHTIRTGTMNRSSRNQEVIVFLCRNLVDILFCVEHQFAFLCLTQIVDHRFFINARFHSQINYGIFFRIYHVVTFILCIVHTETITDKLSGRMHLQTQITSTYRIQKVETDGEVFSKACFHRFTKQLFTFQQTKSTEGSSKRTPFTSK